MGRKKKVVAENVGEKKPEEPLPTQQMPLVVAIPPVEQVTLNGVAPIPMALASAETIALIEKIREDAVAWAVECGLKGDFLVNGPERVDYPQRGHGYCVTIKEQEGKQRLGSARFTAEGVRSYWSIDGIVTG